jgi:hypothetical protein
MLDLKVNWNNLDCDGDGVINGTEISDSTNPQNPCAYILSSVTLNQGGQWSNADCDGDGVINATEIADASNPLNPCSYVPTSITLAPTAAWNALDCDGDGVINATEADSTDARTFSAVAKLPLKPCNTGKSQNTRGFVMTCWFTASMFSQ